MPHQALDPRFNDLLDVNASVDQVATGFGFTEGPLWHPVEQHLIFSDLVHDVRRRWSREEGIEDIMRPTQKANGLTYDHALHLLACEHSTSSVVRIAPDGRRTVLTSHFQGQELNSPNDICVRSDGTIYFTDPTYGRMARHGLERPCALDFQGVYRLLPGHQPGDEPLLIAEAETFTQPNGLCLSPDERVLYVNDSEQANIRAYDLSPDGTASVGRIFAEGIRADDDPGVPDGMKADRAGNVYVTGPYGVWVYGADGTRLGEIRVPEPVANLHWGGPDYATLFFCATTSVYALSTRVSGRTEPFMQANG